jgi:hypothetical protein
MTKAGTIALALCGAFALSAPIAEARITRIEIDPALSQSPTFGGYSWPGVGQYEKVVGIAYGEVNPRDRQNRDIVDIEFAPRNARGNVEYAFNFYILKPIDLKKGARKMMYAAHGRRRSAPVPRRALWDARRLCRRGEEGCGQRGLQGLSARRSGAGNRWHDGEVLGPNPGGLPERLESPGGCRYREQRLQSAQRRR